MAGNLIIPRVEVYWGKVNLTSYNGDGNYPKGEPVVYKVECRLPHQSDNPDASMMWSPTKGAFDIYQDLVTNHINEQIVTTFGYLGKKKISLVWIWGGQQYTYGNKMDLKVTLLSELSGLINARIRSVNNVEEKAMSMLAAIKKTEKFYEVEKFKLLKYTKTAQKDLEKYTIENHYGRDQTFVSSVNNIVRENGNYVFSTNIVSEADVSNSVVITGKTETASKLVVFTPFTYEKNEDTVVDGQSRPYETFPDPVTRYGYLLGPSMFDTMERTYRWSPPQEIQTSTPAKQTVPQGNKDKKTAKSKKPPVNTNVDRASNGKGAVQAAALAATHPNIKIAKDSVGPTKQIAQQQEAAAQLSFNTFLVPALVGIKPYDIIYIPSLNPKTTSDIEDWIVNTVDYNQTDGGVSVSVTATRVYGAEGTLMNSASGKKFLEKAKTLTTLEKWEEYAWIITSTESKASADTLSNGEVNPTLAENYRRSGDSFGDGPVSIPVIPYRP